MRQPSSTTIVATYLERLHEIRSTHRQTPELSHRGASENLLNAMANPLDPAVQATGELADTGERDGRFMSNSSSPLP